MMDSLYAYRSPLHAAPPLPGQPVRPHQPDDLEPTRRVVLVLIDALRLDTSLDPQVMPVLNGLRARGASATMHSRPPSFSEPGYTTILTGAWPDINDSPPINLDYEEIPTFTQDDIFSAAHRAGLRTALAGYYWFERMIPQDSLDASFYTPGEDAAADQEVLTAAQPWLAQDYQLVLIHLDQVDYAGHYEGGPRDPRWNAAASRADALVGEVLARLDLDQDTVLVLSDHGQIDRGGHGGPEPVVLTEPFVLAGAGVRPGAYSDIRMVDVAPTLAALLGTSLPASSQGRPLIEMLTLGEHELAPLRDALAIQQTQLAEAYAAAIGEPLPARTPQDDPVAAAQQAMDRIRLERLAAERAWRAPLAALLAAAAGMFFALRREKGWSWLLAGALTSAALFHVRYAVVDGLTYSLSSVVSQDWLIGYVVPTAALSLLAGWLVTALGTRALRLGPRQAARSGLGLVWLTLCILALPALASFAINGPFTTWTLPEFYSSYLALLALIQVAVAAALGLVLTGLSAAIAGLFRRKEER
jgi:hypothetical protein